MDESNIQNNTESQITNKKTNSNNATAFIRLIINLIPVLVFILIISSHFGIFGESKAESAAEKHVNQCVFQSLGIVPTNFRTTTIYRDGNKRLIEVKFGLDSNDWDGTYCVCTNGKYVVNSTSMLGAGYDCESNLNELKALFGV